MVFRVPANLEPEQVPLGYLEPGVGIVSAVHGHIAVFPDVYRLLEEGVFVMEFLAVRERWIPHVDVLVHPRVQEAREPHLDPVEERPSFLRRPQFGDEVDARVFLEVVQCDVFGVHERVLLMTL